MKFLICIRFISYPDKYLHFRCARNFSCPNQTFSIKDIWRNIFYLIGTELILPSLHILGKDQVSSYSAANPLMHTCPLLTLPYVNKVHLFYLYAPIAICILTFCSALAINSKDSISS